MDVTPWNFPFVLKLWKPDLLFVESAWMGRWNSWRYRIASYPDHPKRSNARLARVVEAARDAQIPAVFWNREDGAHFDRFVDSARHFDRIYTVDENTIPRYRKVVSDQVPVDVMMFAAQPAIHFPRPTELARRASFVGSYDRHIHPRRRAWQDMIFEAAEAIGLTVYDRNSSRRPEKYRYPDRHWIKVRKAIRHEHTAEVYRGHVVNINVNTVDRSATAFSRRLVEILACGGFAVTNPTPAVARLFGDFCRVLDNGEEAKALFERLAREGLSHAEREQTRAAADHVQRNHTWRHRLEQVAGACG
jgi:spore maturation protein CgeB